MCKVSVSVCMTTPDPLAVFVLCFVGTALLAASQFHFSSVHLIGQASVMPPEGSIIGLGNQWSGRHISKLSNCMFFNRKI